MSAALTLPSDHEIVLRIATEADMALVFDTWTKSGQAFLPQYAKTYGYSRWDWVAKCAEWCAHNGRVVCAHMEAYPDVVLGWACGDSRHDKARWRIDYVYVKHDARRKGLGRMLVAGLGLAQARGVRITHRPHKKLREKAAVMGWQYKPLTREEMGL